MLLNYGVFHSYDSPLGWKLESNGMKRRKEIIPPQKEK